MERGWPNLDNATKPSLLQHVIDNLNDQTDPVNRNPYSFYLLPEQMKTVIQFVFFWYFGIFKDSQELFMSWCTIIHHPYPKLRHQ